MNVLADAFKAKGGKWIDSAAANYDGAVAATVSRIAGGDAPSAVLLVPGDTIDELYNSGMLRSLDDLAADGNWSSQIPGPIWKYLETDGHLVSLPMGTHGDNWIWYSKKIFDQLDLQEPATWDEFFAAADKIEEAGYVGVAIGGEPWQISYLWVNIMLGLGGADLYRDLFVDLNADATKSPKVTEAFEMLRKLSGYADKGSPGRSWNETTSMVATDRAGMQLMGDWAKGEFSAAGRVPNKDFGCFLAPAENSAYVFVVDVMTFPTTDDASERDAQNILAQLIMNPEVSVNMAVKKGSVPGLTDISREKLDYCGAIASEALTSDENALPSLWVTYTSDSRGQLMDLLGRFWSDKTMTAEDATAELTTIYQSM
ncbi:ABC transporter substrate-binding protein [Mesorhizobium sp. 10J20-29]